MVEGSAKQWRRYVRIKLAGVEMGRLQDDVEVPRNVCASVAAPQLQMTQSIFDCSAQGTLATIRAYSLGNRCISWAKINV